MTRGLELRSISILLLLFLIPSFIFVLVFAGIYQGQQEDRLDGYLALGRRTLESVMETAELELIVTARHLGRLYRRPESIAQLASWLGDTLPERMGTVVFLVQDGALEPDFPDLGKNKGFNLDLPAEEDFDPASLGPGTESFLAFDPAPEESAYRPLLQIDRGSQPYSSLEELARLFGRLQEADFAVLQSQAEMFGIHRASVGDYEILLFQRVDLGTWVPLKNSIGLNFVVYRHFPRQALVSNMPPQFAQLTLEDEDSLVSLHFELEKGLEPSTWVQVSIPKAQLQSRTDFFLQVFLVYFLVLGISVLLAIWVLRILVLNRIHGLAEQARRIREDLQEGRTPEPLNIPGEDEISGLAETLSELSRDLHSLGRDMNARVEAQTDRLTKSSRSAQLYYQRVSREARSPIQAIIGHAERLQESLKDEASAELASLLLREAGRLEDLTNQATILGRLDSGSVPLEMQRFSIRDFAQRLEARLAFDFPTVGTRFSLSMGREVPQIILGDENLLLWLWSLCIAEALRSDGSRMVRLSVQIQGFTDTAVQLRFALRFYGKPVPMGEDATISMVTAGKILSILDSEFETGVQVEEGEAHEIAASIWFGYSRRRIHFDEHFNVEETAKPGLQGSSLLLALRAGSTRDYLVQMIQESGMRILIADNGAQVVRLAQELHPRIILMERSLPELSASDIIRNLKSSSSTPAVPIILIQDEWMDTTEFRNHEGLRILRMPIRRGELISALEDASQWQEELRQEKSGEEKFRQENSRDEKIHLGSWDPQLGLASGLPDLRVSSPSDALDRIGELLHLARQEGRGVTSKRDAGKGDAGRGVASKRDAGKGDASKADAGKRASGRDFLREARDISAAQAFLGLEQLLSLLLLSMENGAGEDKLQVLYSRLAAEQEHIAQMILSARSSG